MNPISSEAEHYRQQLHAEALREGVIVEAAAKMIVNKWKVADIESLLELTGREETESIISRAQGRAKEIRKERRSNGKGNS